MDLVWYRFKTKSVDDVRPLIDMKDIQMPYWCTGYASDDSYATIVCFLPKGEDLYKYWDDAYDIDSDERDGITYTDRFPKPDWILTEKQKLLEYMDNPVETKARNSMGCSENWYNPYYAIKETFSREKIENMSDEEIENLVKLADEIGLALY